MADEDVYCELVKFGNLLEMHVCDNVGDHLIGNVYARYEFEDDTMEAVTALNSRWYAGKPRPPCQSPRLASPCNNSLTSFLPAVSPFAPQVDHFSPNCRR